MKRKATNWRQEQKQAKKRETEIWILTGSGNEDITALRQKDETLVKWGKGFEAFIKAHSPCQIYTKSDFLSDSPEERDSGIALARKLGTEVWECDAEEFAKEKERMLRDPEMRAKIEAKVPSCPHHANLNSIEEWEWIQSEMKERGVQIGSYFLEPKPGTFAFEFFRRSNRQLGLEETWEDSFGDAIKDYKNKLAGFDLGTELLFVFDDSSALYPALPQAKENGTPGEQHAYQHLQETWDEYSKVTDLARQRGITMYAGPGMTLRLQQWALHGGPGGELAQKTLGLFATTADEPKQSVASAAA